MTLRKSFSPKTSSSIDCFSENRFLNLKNFDRTFDLRFEFLKCFLVDPSFQSMRIETWYKEPVPQLVIQCLQLTPLEQPCLRQHVRKETARYTELPLDELEQKYDPEWLEKHVVSRGDLRTFSC